MAFHDDFTRLTGNPPFPWQRALYERFLARDFPKACDLPTGLGKTSVITFWLLALAKNPKLRADEGAATLKRGVAGNAVLL